MVFPLEMGWRHLLFESWPVDPDAMAAHLPGRLEPNEYDGSAWLSVVPFALAWVALGATVGSHARQARG